MRSYSPGYAVGIFKDLRENFGVKEILIEDDTFVFSRGRVQEFCERLIAERIDVTWSCLGRADRVTPDTLKMLKRAGCWHISYGIESGDQGILDSMQKGETISQIEDAVSWAREAGLKTTGFFMVGFPGETEDSLALTEELIMRLPLDDISVMQMTPFPGTAIFKEAHECGRFEQDWSKMNALNTVFVPHGIREADLEKARLRMLRRFYFRPSQVLKKFLSTVRSPRRIRHVLRGFFALTKALAKGRRK